MNVTISLSTCAESTSGISNAALVFIAVAFGIVECLYVWWVMR